MSPRAQAFRLSRAVQCLSAGTLLQMFTFESALRTVTADPGEHTLYAGAVDGRIFAGDLIPGSSRPEAAAGHMQSSKAPVNCLACTPDATQLVAGEEDPGCVNTLVVLKVIRSGQIKAATADVASLPSWPSA